MSTLVFDIETIPGPEADAHPEAMAEMAGTRKDCDARKLGSLCPALARPVAIGMMFDGGHELRVAYDSTLVDHDGQAPEGMRVLACEGEAQVLDLARLAIAKASALVTFNGRAFDIPLLIHRMRINDIDVPSLLMRAIEQKPWESGYHQDLASILSFGGATQRYSLRAYAIAYGLGDPKQDGDGAGVYDLVQARDGRRVCEYAAGDVRTTAALWGLAR